MAKSTQQQIDSEMEDITVMLGDVRKVQKKVECKQTNEWLLERLKHIKHHLGGLNDVCTWINGYIEATAEI